MEADRLLSSVMSFPAEGVESAIKNNIEDMRLFLDAKHPGHYAVYNLSPRTYRASKFHNRVSVPCSSWHDPSGCSPLNTGSCGNEPPGCHPALTCLTHVACR